jgi:hypothetical protein
MRAGMEGRASDLPIIRQFMGHPEWDWLDRCEDRARRRIIKGMRRSGYSARTAGRSPA